jgi:hypothetical protein
VRKRRGADLLGRAEQQNAYGVEDERSKLGGSTGDVDERSKVTAEADIADQAFRRPNLPSSKSTVGPPALRRFRRVYRRQATSMRTMRVRTSSAAVTTSAGTRLSSPTAAAA